MPFASRLLTSSVLALSLATTAAQAEMNEDERADFRDEVRAYLLENPEVLLEAFEVLEQRQADQKAAADLDLVASNADAIFDDGHSWVGGNPDGDVTVVEFMDYRCGYCRKAFEEVETLVNTDGNIRFILKEFPILGEESVAASRFAVATQLVAGADAYKQVHDALMTYQGSMDDAGFTRLAEGLGIDATPILAETNSDEVNRILSDNHRLAQVLQVNGTPTFIMGDEVVRGYVPLEAMQKIVEDERS